MVKEYHVEVIYDTNNHDRIERHVDRVYSLNTLDEAVYLCDDLYGRLESGEAEFVNAISTIPYVRFRNKIVYQPVS